MAVSYTHLDVYKRQVSVCEHSKEVKFLTIIFLLISNKMRNNLLEQQNSYHSKHAKISFQMLLPLSFQKGIIQNSRPTADCTLYCNNEYLVLIRILSVR